MKRERRQSSRLERIERHKRCADLHLTAAAEHEVKIACLLGENG